MPGTGCGPPGPRPHRASRGAGGGADRHRPALAHPGRPGRRRRPRRARPRPAGRRRRRHARRHPGHGARTPMGHRAALAHRHPHRPRPRRRRGTRRIRTRPTPTGNHPPTSTTQSAADHESPVADDHLAGDENLVPAGDLEAPADADEAPARPARRRRCRRGTTPNRRRRSEGAGRAGRGGRVLRGRGAPVLGACLPDRSGPAGHRRRLRARNVDRPGQPPARAGYTDQEILAAGLARHSSRGGLIDFFHNRAVLPITRPQDGAVVAFIGRKHPDDTNDRAPKYLNSPTTMVFRKSDLPFGLTPQQVAVLRAGADLVIVEGPMDALAVNVARPDLVAVAPLGTALTPGHLTTLNRIAPLTDRRVLLAPGRRQSRPGSLRQGMAGPGRRRCHRCRGDHPRRREGPGGTARQPRARTPSPTALDRPASAGRPRRGRDHPPLDRRQRLRRTPDQRPPRGRASNASKPPGSAEPAMLVAIVLPTPYARKPVRKRTPTIRAVRRVLGAPTERARSVLLNS